MSGADFDRIDPEDVDATARMLSALWEGAEAEGLQGDELRVYMTRTFARIQADLIATARETDFDCWR